MSFAVKLSPLLLVFSLSRAAAAQPAPLDRPSTLVRFKESPAYALALEQRIGAGEWTRVCQAPCAANVVVGRDVQHRVVHQGADREPIPVTIPRAAEALEIKLIAPNKLGLIVGGALGVGIGTVASLAGLVMVAFSGVCPYADTAASKERCSAEAASGRTWGTIIGLTGVTLTVASVVGIVAGANMKPSEAEANPVGSDAEANAVHVPSARKMEPMAKSPAMTLSIFSYSF